MTYLDRVRFTLGNLEERSLRRELRDAIPDGAVDFASNDYLGLAHHRDVVAALHAGDRVGSGGSRLLSGAHREHAALEADLAAWTGRERALLFSSGYLAMLGAVVTLAPFVERGASDERNHACAIDALRLTKIARTVHPHAAPPPGDARVPTMFVTESLFGMNGTRVDVGARIATLGANDVLIVDEAHALGVTGPGGAGLCAGYDDPRVVVVGTLSKALGGAGGFVAGPAETIAYLATAARTFVFDTAPPPPLARALRAAVGVARSAEGDARRRCLRERARALCAYLREAGVAVPATDGPIVPLVVGAAADALAVGRTLETRGFFAPAIRPPTVPAGEAQIRVTLRSDHSDDDVRAFARAFASARR